MDRVSSEFMKLHHFNETQLAQKIEELSKADRAAFAAACAERMTSSYARCSARANTEDSRTFRQILTRLWRDLDGEPMSDRELEEQIKSCMELISREDAEPWVSDQEVADDALAALAYALECRRTGLGKEAAWAARRSYETLDTYVINHENIDTNIPGAEAQVLAHPLVQAELARLQRDLDELLHGAITIDRLRERAKAEASEFLP